MACCSNVAEIVTRDRYERYEDYVRRTAFLDEGIRPRTRLDSRGNVSTEGWWVLIGKPKRRNEAIGPLHEMHAVSVATACEGRFSV
jgi:hypothetical protein